ncbi:MAG: RNA methyltransferase [Polyangia bacterium]
MSKGKGRDADDLVEKYGMDAVIAALGPMMMDERRERLERTLTGRLSGVSVVLENLTDPHNGGAALRSCEAFGLLSVYIVGQPLRFSERVTQGCEKWLHLEEHAHIAPLAEKLKQEGRKLYAAVPDAKLPLESLDPAAPAVFLVGNEHDGLTDEARSLCDLEYALPMQGFSESVNLSVATALTIYTHARRRREHLGRDGDLDEVELARLRASYYARSVDGAAAIVRRHLTGRTS